MKGTINPLLDLGHSGPPKITYEDPNTPKLSHADLLRHQVDEELKRMGMSKVTDNPHRNNWNYLYETLFTTCPKMEKAKQMARLISGKLNGYPALITGPTGTGKEQLAKIIHGARPPEYFISANCGGLVDTLFESILFGYKANSFTGASKQDRDGIFIAARHGTVFLDEIALLPKRQQGALMTALSTRRVQPVGDTESYPFECQVVVATNRDLAQMVRDGEFMEDLYFRCCRFIIRTTSLAERPLDAPHIAKSLLAARPDLYGYEPIDEHAEQIPITSGNVRAIEHWLARRALALENEELIDGLEIR